MKRIYVFTGKGGVGKTSTAAAHAVKSAREGVNTLLVSTDMAHNLGDLFECPIGKEPLQVMENLKAYEIDPGYVMEHDFSEMMSAFLKIIPRQEETSVQEFGFLPGMEELFSLLKIAEIYKKEDYQRIIVDCAPTGETLSLLKFPELLSWYMEKLFPLGKAAMRVLAPVSKKVFRVELPNKAAMTDIEKMYLKLYELQELLKDREITSVRLVTVPEKMVLEETKRNYMYMNLYNFNVDGVYINRILPENIGNPFFEEWLKLQKRYVSQTEETFAAVPIFRIPWYGEEIRGLEAVVQMSREALGNENGDVFASRMVTEREHFVENEKGYLLRVSVPGAPKEKLDLYQAQTDVVIKIGNFKRNIPLPNVLRTYRIAEAKLEDGILNIQFIKEEMR